jgi:hypothetical protein
VAACANAAVQRCEAACTELRECLVQTRHSRQLTASRCASRCWGGTVFNGTVPCALCMPEASFDCKSACHGVASTGGLLKLNKDALRKARVLGRRFFDHPVSGEECSRTRVNTADDTALAMHGSPANLSHTTNLSSTSIFSHDASGQDRALREGRPVHSDRAGWPVATVVAGYPLPPSGRRSARPQQCSPCIDHLS